MESSINFEATSFKTVRSNRNTVSDSDESKTNTDASNISGVDQGVTGTAPPLPRPPHQQAQPSLPQQSQHSHSHTVNVIGSYDYTGKRLMPPGALLRIGFTGAVKFEYGDKGIELDRASMIRMNEGVRSPGVYWLGGTRVKNMFSQFIGDYKQGDIKKETQLIVLEFFLKPLHLILDSNKLFQIYDNIFQIKMGDKEMDSVYSDLINNEQYKDLIEVINKMFEKTTWIIARVDYTEPTNKRQQDLQFNFTLPPFHHDMQQGEKEDSASNTAATSSSIVSKFSKVNIEKIDEEKIRELQRDYKQLSDALDKERSIYRESLVKHEDRIKEITHNYHNERANVMEILVKQLEDDIVYMKNKLGDTMDALYEKVNVDMQSFLDNMKMDIDGEDENKKYIENFNTLFNYYMEIQNKLHHQQLQELQNKNHQQLQELQNENHQQLQELQNENQQQLQELQNENHQQIQELQQQIQQLQNANQQLQELQNANQQQFQQRQNANQQQFQQQFQQLKNVNQQQCQQLQNANQQLQELQNVSQKLENTNKIIKEKVKKQNTEVEKLKTELEKQKTKFEDSQKQLENTFEQKKKFLENTFEQKKKFLETTFEKKRKVLENKQKDMESQLNKLEEQKKQFEKQVEELQQQLRKKKTRKAENPEVMETEKLMKRKATEEPQTLKQEPKILKLNPETPKVDPKEPKTSKADSADEL